MVPPFAKMHSISGKAEITFVKITAGLKTTPKVSSLFSFVEF